MSAGLSERNLKAVAENRGNIFQLAPYLELKFVPRDNIFCFPNRSQLEVNVFVPRYVEVTACRYLRVAPRVVLCFQGAKVSPLALGCIHVSQLITPPNNSTILLGGEQR
jgi:hypothetical protein